MNVTEDEYDLLKGCVTISLRSLVEAERPTDLQELEKRTEIIRDMTKLSKAMSRGKDIFTAQRAALLVVSVDTALFLFEQSEGWRKQFSPGELTETIRQLKRLQEKLNPTKKKLYGMATPIKRSSKPLPIPSEMAFKCEGMWRTKSVGMP